MSIIFIILVLLLMILVMEKRLKEILENSAKRRIDKEATYIAEHKIRHNKRSKMKLGTLGKDNIV